MTGFLNSATTSRMISMDSASRRLRCFGSRRGASSIRVSRIPIWRHLPLLRTASEPGSLAIIGPSRLRQILHRRPLQRLVVKVSQTPRPAERVSTIDAGQPLAFRPGDLLRDNDIIRAASAPILHVKHPPESLGIASTVMMNFTASAAVEPSRTQKPRCAIKSLNLRGFGTLRLRTFAFAYDGRMSRGFSEHSLDKAMDRSRPRRFSANPAPVFGAMHLLVRALDTTRSATAADSTELKPPQHAVRAAQLAGNIHAC